MFLRCTTYQLSITGKPSISSTASFPACNSSPTVCADRNAIPMLAITACLMVSVLLISMAMRRLDSRPAKPSCIEFHVSDPFSRETKASSANADSGMLRLPTSGWLGAATMT
ncbi:hypothetical protein D9M68_837700 [compost metagenome]